jgi:hypothetical protein
VNPGTNSGACSKKIVQHAKITMCPVLQWYLTFSTRPSHEAIDSAPPPAAEPFHQTLHDATINQLPTSSSSQPPTPSTSQCVHHHTTYFLIRRLSHKAEHCLSRERERELIAVPPCTIASEGPASTQAGWRSTNPAAARAGSCMQPIRLHGIHM